MAGPVPAIHAVVREKTLAHLHAAFVQCLVISLQPNRRVTAWMAGTSPAMTRTSCDTPFGMAADAQGLHPHTLPITSPRNPTASRLPAISTSRTVRVWPGSKRVAVPAGMSRRKPFVAARSKLKAGLVSKKW